MKQFAIHIGSFSDIREFVALAIAQPFEVLIGSGVKATAITIFKERFPQASAFHMSGKIELCSGMLFRREGVPMGIPGFDEWHIPVTSQEAVAAAKALLAE